MATIRLVDADRAEALRRIDKRWGLRDKQAAAKAADRHPQDDELTVLEERAADNIYIALQRWARGTLRGVTAANVQDVIGRIDDRALTQPLQDAIVAFLRESAEYGVDIGRLYIERDVLGVVKRNILDVSVWDLANEAAASWAEMYGLQLTRQLAQTTTPRIQKLIAEWIRNGEPFYMLRDRIMDGYFFSASRAETIAVTEVTRAFARGNLAAWEQSGVTDGKKWQTAVDELVCPICAPLHNKVVGLGNQWTTRDGGISSPPAHVRCRCWLVPYIDIDKWT